MSPSNAPEPSARARAQRWITRHAYLIVAAGALLVLSRTVDFSPPELVRVDPSVSVDAPAELVGEFPERSFDELPVDPHAVQVRATLRRYQDPELLAEGPDMEADERGLVISQPVVTTLLGVKAAIDQTVRLEGGNLAINLSVAATPRVVGEDGRALELEHSIRVASVRAKSWRTRERRRVHLQTRGVLSGVEGRGHRIVFAVEEHLFSLDLELQRG